MKDGDRMGIDDWYTDDLLVRVREQMARADWHYRLTQEEADRLREWVTKILEQQ